MVYDHRYKAQRTDVLLDLYNNFRPDVVVTEMWPYARANFDFELIPLADAVRHDENSGRVPPPRLYSIARDIMFPPKILSPIRPA